MTKRRTKGDGSLVKLPNGSWKMTITIGRDMEGKQRRKSVTAKTRKEVLDKINELRYKYQVGDFEKRVVTFKEYVEKWLEVKENSVSYNTYQTYKGIVKKCRELNDYPMDRIKASTINDVLLSLRNERTNKPISQGTLRTVKTVLSTIFMAAVNEDVILKTPMRGTVKPAKTLKKVDMILPTPEEMRRILKEAKRDDKVSIGVIAGKIYPFMLLAVATGMRKGELAGLKWSNVDFQKNIITVCSQATREGFVDILKTESSYRSISVSPEVLKVIQQIPKGLSPYVFAGNCKSASSLLYSIGNTAKRVFKNAGVSEGITLHSLRHYHATQLLTKGINVKVISKRLGHSSITITLDAYVHFLPSMDQEASRLIGKDYII